MWPEIQDVTWLLICDFKCDLVIKVWLEGYYVTWTLRLDLGVNVSWLNYWALTCVLRCDLNGKMWLKC